jgi:hypothetical protein
MTGQNLSGFDAVLKDVYGPRIEEQLNLVCSLSDWIDEDDAADWTGRQVIYPIHVARNQGVGASAEGARLPQAGAQSYADVKIPEKYNYGRIQLTGQVIKASTENKGAFTRAMESELKGLVKDMGNDRERQFFGAGNGVLCLVQGASQATTTSNTLAIDSPFGITPTTNGCRFLQPGMVCTVLAPSTTAVEGTFTVTATAAFNAAGTVVTLSSIIGPAGGFSDNARIVRGNADVPAGTTNNYANEVMGLLGLVDDGTYCATLHNIARATYPIFNSPVIANIGGLTVDVIQRLIDASDELGGGDFASDGVFFCHYSVRREYLKLLQPDRRYTGADLNKPDGGTKNAALKRGGEITYGDRPWKVAKHMPYGTLFGFLKGSITRYIHVRGEWADEDERILRNVVGYDAWEAFYRIFDNLHMDRPNEGFRGDGINAAVTVNHNY